jgi:hypothetical protein
VKERLLAFTCIFINESTHSSSNFMVVGIISATNNVCPNDVDDKFPFIIDEKCWKYDEKSNKDDPSYGITSDSRENCPDAIRLATNDCNLFCRIYFKYETIIYLITFSIDTAANLADENVV